MKIRALGYILLCLLVISNIPVSAASSSNVLHIKSINLVNNQQNVKTDINITITFSVYVKQSSFFNKISFIDSTGNTVKYSALIKRSVLEIHPASKLKEGMVYTLNIPSNAVTDNSGKLKNKQLGLKFKTQMPVNSKLNRVKMISVGYDSCVELKADGTVWTWGKNYYGQLGDGTTIDNTKPAQVKGIDNVKMVCAGDDHIVALRNDGTVWAWGNNECGQLGDGTNIDRKKPVKVEGISNVKMITAGTFFTAAVKNDGTLWTWGAVLPNLGDESGLSNESDVVSNIPLKIEGINDINMISAGGYFMTILKNDGTVWAWGYNNSGQLGNATNIDEYIPVQVLKISDIKMISAGQNHVLALKNDGTVWSWGNNEWGRLGDGSEENQSVPVQLQGLSDVKSIAAGNAHSLALKNDGTVWGWGCNDFGELGSKNNPKIAIPKTIDGVSNILEVSAGTCHSALIKKDGQVLEWGWDYSFDIG